MTEWIVIVSLAVCLMCTAVMLFIMAKKQTQDIDWLMDAYSNMTDKYNDSMLRINELNAQYSKSLDDRERSFNDIQLRCKKLEIELGEKEAEIIKLQAKLYSLSDVMNSEVLYEKEEVKKEVEET